MYCEDVFLTCLCFFCINAYVFLSCSLLMSNCWRIFLNLPVLVYLPVFHKFLCITDYIQLFTSIRANFDLLSLIYLHRYLVWVNKYSSSRSWTITTFCTKYIFHNLPITKYPGLPSAIDELKQHFTWCLKLH